MNCPRTEQTLTTIARSTGLAPGAVHRLLAKLVCGVGRGGLGEVAPGPGEVLLVLSPSELREDAMAGGLQV